MSTKNYSKKLPILMGVFVAQIALAIILFAQGQSSSDFRSEPLIAVTLDAIDRVEVFGTDGEIKMNKSGSAWAFENGLPVRQDGIDFIIDSLAKLKTAWPVASSVTSHERFKVAGDVFERKIKLSESGKELATVYIGSSPSFRHSHIRVEGKDEIYSLVFDAYATPANVDGWIDTHLLRPSGEIQELSNGGSGLVKVDGSWPDASQSAHDSDKGNQALVDDVETKPTFDPLEFEKSLDGLVILGVAENLSVFDQPVSSLQSDENSEADGVIQKFSFSVKSNESAFNYELLKKDSEYFIRSDMYEQVFKISESTFIALSKILELV